MEERQNDLCRGNFFHNKFSHYFCSVGDDDENAPAMKKTYYELIKMCHFCGFAFFSWTQSQLSTKPEIPKLTFCSFFSRFLYSLYFLSRRMHDRSMRPRSMQTRWKMLAIRPGCHLLVPIGIRWRFVWNATRFTGEKWDSIYFFYFLGSGDPKVTNGKCQQFTYLLSMAFCDSTWVHEER